MFPKPFNLPRDRAEGIRIQLASPRKFLVVLCGLPSSGKTTLATHLALAMEHSGIPVAVVGSDDFRRMMPIYRERFPPEREPVVRELTLQTIRLLLKTGVSVISDDTNYYSSVRHKLVELARQTGAAYAIIAVETPLEVALKWNEERGLPIPQEVITSISEKFEKPGSKYKWDRSLVSVDLSKTKAEECAREILKLLLSLKQEGRDKISVKGSAAEEIDKATRRVVSEVVKRAPAAAKVLSGLRKSFVREALKAGLSTVEAEKAFRERVEEVLNELDSKGRGHNSDR
ncbi:MAG: AAA family ATPase [Candidatus Jordarchaeales archaeon]